MKNTQKKLSPSTIPGNFKGRPKTKGNWAHLINNGQPIKKFLTLSFSTRWVGFRQKTISRFCPCKGNLDFFLSEECSRKKRGMRLPSSWVIFWIGIARFFFKHRLKKSRHFETPIRMHSKGTKTTNYQPIKQNQHWQQFTSFFCCQSLWSLLTLKRIEKPWRDQYPLLYFELAQGPEFTLERCLYSWKVIFCRWKADV